MTIIIINCPIKIYYFEYHIQRVESLQKTQIYHTMLSTSLKTLKKQNELRHRLKNIEKYPKNSYTFFLIFEINYRFKFT